MTLKEAEQEVERLVRAGYLTLRKVVGLNGEDLDYYLIDYSDEYQMIPIISILLAHLHENESPEQIIMQNARDIAIELIKRGILDI